MSSKGNVVYGSSLRRWVLAIIIILCAVVWWASANALAQDTAPTGFRVDAQPTLWSSLARPGSSKAPYLVIGMTEHWDTRPHGSFRIAPDEATNPSAGKTILRQAGSGASVDRAEKPLAGSLLLSSALDPTAGVRGFTNFRGEPPNPRQTSESSPDLAGTEVYSLLDDRSAPGSFLFGYQMNYFPSKQWIADEGSFTHEIVLEPRPLLQLEFGTWHLPVALSKAALSQ
jgi:hypothetical protein